MAVPGCLQRGRPGDVLLAAGRGARRRQREATAKSYCARCPVIDACLEHALAVRESHGVWGGLNTDERRALQQQQIAS